MSFGRMLSSISAAALVALGATAASAQDYTVTAVTGQYVSPPSTASDLGLTGDDVTKNLASTPFPIGFYGRTFSTLTVSTNGFILFGGGAANGCCSAQGGPFASGSYDGVCSVAWADLDGINSTLTSAIKYWSDGTAPNRRFIMSWNNWSLCCSYNGTINFQVQFYEATGRIVMAYTSGWTASASYGVGIDEYQGANRWTRPPAPGSSSGVYTFNSPANDWQFDPKITNFTGSVFYDRYVVDNTGIGNTSDQNIPASGLKVELRDAANAVAASGFTDSAGAFAIQGTALVGTAVGSLVVTGQTPICTVTQTTGGVALGYTLASNVSFAANLAVGSLQITEGLDPGGLKRAPLNIARTIQGVYDWCTSNSRTGKTIPFIEVLYDTTSTLPSTYLRAGFLGAQVRVSTAAANPDGWDAAVIRKTYARHVLSAISAVGTTPVDTTFDAATDDENAFAEGFGYYLNTAVNGDTTFFDGLGKSAANSINLESPAGLSTAAGSKVASAVAQALFDLTDDANEVWDTIDGRGTATDRPFRTAASFAVPVTASNFYVKWGQLGYDGTGLSSNFIHHVLISDDADEPNDDASHAKVVAQFGFIRNNRVLNLYNEDWYEFTMPQPTNRLFFQVSYDRIAFNTTLLLELQDATGAVVLAGAAVGSSGPVQGITGALPAAVYRIRVKHLSGISLTNYSLQVFSELAFSSAAFQPWTVSRPYNVPVNIKGGIPPYQLAVESPFVKPPGLVLDGANAKVGGIPSAAGTFNFILSAKDAASPVNLVSGPVKFVVNDQLALTFGEFLAVALDKAVSRPLPYVGGTAPYTNKLDEGVLPHGVSTAPGTLTLTGKPDSAGAFPFKMTATDLALSSATLPTTGVVCVPFGTTPLALGASACGFYFDAVAGSTVSIAINTESGQPKRALRAVLLDVDGNTVLPVATKSGRGKVSVSGFVAPTSGRYYCVVAADTGDASRIVGSGKITANAKSAGTSGKNSFVVGKFLTVEIGALAGASLSFSAKPDASGLALRAVYLVDPTGAIVTFAAGEVSEKGNGISFTKVLPVSGTWKMYIGAKPGRQGSFKYSYKLKEPKGVTYSAG